jgi:hypothetical protein
MTRCGGSLDVMLEQVEVFGWISVLLMKIHVWNCNDGETSN